MFVDASAIIAIIGDEEDRLSLSVKLAGASTIYVSPVVYYEATLGLARKRDCPIEQAEELVDLFIEETSAEMVEISATIGQQAVNAFRLFGKGRHRADLNMGDCFAYACAQAYRVPLLFKGNDFGHTDIATA